MKELIVSAVILAALACPLHAAQYDASQVGTNQSFAANTTNTVTTPAITATKWDDVGIQLGVTNPGTDTSPVTVSFFKSGDGTNYDVSPFAVLSVSCGSAASTYAVTNLSLKSIGYLRAGQVINATTNAITLAIKTLLKPKRTGTE